MTNALTPNPAKAIETLTWLLQGAPFYLERMESEGSEKPVAKTYLASKKVEAQQFIATNNNPDYRRNIYFVANSEFLTGERRKANLEKVRFLQIDVDTKDFLEEHGDWASAQDAAFKMLAHERTRPKTIPEPSLVWFTGGGYQAVWRLKEPIAVDQADDLNAALIESIGGDFGTHDAGHLLRLPYTVNWLNNRKREAGRMPEMARVMTMARDGDTPRSYSVTDFSVKRRAKKQPSGLPTTQQTAPLDIKPLPLPEDLASILPQGNDWRMAVVDGRVPAGKSYDSRSELLFATLLWMLSGGVSPGHALSVILDPTLKIGDHIRDRNGDLSYACRQVQRAMEKIAADASDWPRKDGNGNPIKNDADNVRHAFARLGVAARRNEFTQADEIEGFELGKRDINDIGEILSSEFEKEMRFLASPAVIKRELINMAHHARYHPVKEYLGGLNWDGVQRLDTWLSDYCSVTDSALHRAFASKVFIAGVRRIKSPGCKYDTMLVLEGPQGSAKSSLVAAMAVHPDWFCDSLDLRADIRTMAQILDQAWIVESPELSGLSKVAAQELKKFLSEGTDTYRRPYDKTAQRNQRHSILIGTTNETAYLRDLTGNRRFWPVTTGHIDLAGFKEAIDQLWAEAVIREAKGESIELPRALWAEAEVSQAARMLEDPFADILANNFADQFGKVSLEDVKILLGLQPARSAASDAGRIRAVMQSLGWTLGTYRFHSSGQSGGKAKKGFRRVTTGTEEDGPIGREPELRASRRDDGSFEAVIITESTKQPF